MSVGATAAPHCEARAFDQPAAGAAVPAAHGVMSSGQAAHDLARTSSEDRGSKWKEMYSEENQRLYYARDGGGTSWDPPAAFRAADCRVDSGIYGISLEAAERLFDAVHNLQAECVADSWRRTMQLLIRILANVVDCGNQEPKFRSLQLSNDKFCSGVWDVMAGREVLTAVGFQQHDATVMLAADADQRLLQAALARLRRIADNKGHSGSAEFFPIHAAGSAPQAAVPGSSPLLGTAGYHHQQRIYHCSECDHGVNDGSERLFTGLHDAPRGEFRYECATCPGDFNLCEKCWDRLQSGQLRHDGSHRWQHHHPRTQRHNTQGADGSNSTWGFPRGGGGSAARALQRMHERHGIRSPG